MHQQGRHNHYSAAWNDAVDVLTGARQLKDIGIVHQSAGMRTWQDAQWAVVTCRFVEVKPQCDDA